MIKLTSVFTSVLICWYWHNNACMHGCFDTFHPLSCDALSSLIRKLNKISCVLDPFPTKLLMSHLSSILDIILCIVNHCFSSDVLPTSCKYSIIFLWLKKQGLAPEILKNYRPVANLSFISIFYWKSYCNPNTW